MAAAQALREQGNKYFEAAAGAIDIARRRTLLQQAADKYQASFAAATTHPERASACKNLGATAGCLARLGEPAGAPLSDGWRQQLAYSSDAVGHYSRAADYGRLNKPDEWVEQCSSKADATYDLILDGCADDQAATLLVLERVRAGLAGAFGPAGASLLLRIAEKAFHVGVTHSGQQMHRAAARMNGEARRPLAEAEAAIERCGSISLWERAKELQRSLFLHKCICDSAQAREDAEDLIDRGVLSSEELNMEGVHAALDKLKQASILTREVDVEGEAIALSRLGWMYRTLLRDDVRAKRYYLLSMHLATSLAPRAFHFEDWYQDCTQALQRYQEEAVLREEEERAAAREPFLQALASELTALRAASAGGYHELLRHIYAKHPPHDPAQRLEEEPGAGNGKRLLRQALLHYHPDKTPRGADGAVDQGLLVLREEITKELTAKYESFK